MTRKFFGTDGIRGTANREPVTAETALAIPSLVVVLVILVWVLLVVGTQLRAVDAARAAARAVARGESAAESAAVAEQVAPGGVVTITRDGADVRVRVAVTVNPPGGLAMLPAIDVAAVAAAYDEDRT